MANTTVLKIQRHQNVGTIEDLYEQMDSAKGEVAIQPSTRLDDARICGRGDLIQFLLTWADRFPTSDVVTHIQPSASSEEAINQLQSLFDTEHGFVVSRISQKNALLPSRHFCRTDGTQLEESIVVSAFDSPLIKNRPRPMEKGYRGFLCLDNALEERKEYLPGFSNVYKSRAHGFAAREEFDDLLWRLTNRAVKAIKNRDLAEGLTSPKLKTVLSNSSRIFYELFENADRWGRRDFGENSIRGAMVAVHFRESITQTSLSKQVDKDSPLFAYLSESKSIHGAESQEFVEISVFDNGPTLARQYLGRNPRTLKEEWATTFYCLVKAVGKSQYENEGQGLFHVMRLLNSCRGFLRFRAGRLSLFRDFLHDPLECNLDSLDISHPTKDDVDRNSKLMSLRDWRTRSNKISSHPKSIGALFTLLIPINELINE